MKEKIFKIQSNEDLMNARQLQRHINSSYDGWYEVTDLTEKPEECEHISGGLGACPKCGMTYDEIDKHKCSKPKAEKECNLPHDECPFYNEKESQEIMKSTIEPEKEWCFCGDPLNHEVNNWCHRCNRPIKDWKEPIKPKNPPKSYKIYGFIHQCRLL